MLAKWHRSPKVERRSGTVNNQFAHSKARNIHTTVSLCFLLTTFALSQSRFLITCQWSLFSNLVRCKHTHFPTWCLHSEWIGIQLVQCAGHKHTTESPCVPNWHFSWKHSASDIKSMYSTYQMSLLNLCIAILNPIRDDFPSNAVSLSQTQFPNQTSTGYIFRHCNDLLQGATAV